jgi:hypothetical protein
MNFINECSVKDDDDQDDDHGDSKSDKEKDKGCEEDQSKPGDCGEDDPPKESEQKEPEQKEPESPKEPPKEPESQKEPPKTPESPKEPAEPPKEPAKTPEEETKPYPPDQDIKNGEPPSQALQDRFPKYDLRVVGNEVFGRTSDGSFTRVGSYNNNGDFIPDKNQSESNLNFKTKATAKTVDQFPERQGRFLSEAPNGDIFERRTDGTWAYLGHVDKDGKRDDPGAS